MILKLLKITKSTRKDKKLMAHFIINNRVKIIHFGASGYMDYTLFKDKLTADKRKALYIRRHNKDNIYNPTTPGALSYWILWNKRSIQESIMDFKKRFNLN